MFRLLAFSKKKKYKCLMDRLYPWTGPEGSANGRLERLLPE